MKRGPRRGECTDTSHTRRPRSARSSIAAIMLGLGGARRRETVKRPAGTSTRRFSYRRVPGGARARGRSNVQWFNGAMAYARSPGLRPTARAPRRALARSVSIAGEEVHIRLNVLAAGFDSAPTKMTMALFSANSHHGEASGRGRGGRARWVQRRERSPRPGGTHFEVGAARLAELCDSNGLGAQTEPADRAVPLT